MFIASGALGPDSFNNLAALHWRGAPNDRESLFHLDLNGVGLGHGMKGSSGNFKAKSAAFAQAQLLPNRLRNNEPPRFAKDDGSLHTRNNDRKNGKSQVFFASRLPKYSDSALARWPGVVHRFGP
jgi:hypothetical protein